MAENPGSSRGSENVSVICFLLVLPEDSRRTAAGAGRKAEAAKASDVSFQFNICRRKKCVLPAGKGLAIYEI